mmetsp:Transcript_41631/g.96964  ORF Transcript_41631/g.96964 Transcript_41631/m.96964 type:complete len:253 (-) Transcript_41631:107-865(-)
MSHCWQPPSRPGVGSAIAEMQTAWSLSCCAWFFRLLWPWPWLPGPPPRAQRIATGALPLFSRHRASGAFAPQQPPPDAIASPLYGVRARQSKPPPALATGLPTLQRHWQQWSPRFPSEFGRPVWRPQTQLHSVLASQQPPTSARAQVRWSLPVGHAVRLVFLSRPPPSTLATEEAPSLFWGPSRCWDRRRVVTTIDSLPAALVFLPVCATMHRDHLALRPPLRVSANHGQGSQVSSPGSSPGSVAPAAVDSL